MKTVAEMIKLVFSLVPATRTATTSSETVVDCAGHDNVCWVVGAGDLDLASGNETYAAAVYESDNSDGSSASAITGASATLTADNQIAKIQVNGLGTGSRKRYQFCRLTLGGTTPSMPGFALAILSESRGSLNPVQAPDANV